jgi:titin
VLSGTAGAGSNALTWTVPVSDGGSPITGYTVYRNGRVIASVGSTATTYNDLAITKGTTYTYVVRAKNIWAASAASNSVALTAQ